MVEHILQAIITAFFVIVVSHYYILRRNKKELIYSKLEAVWTNLDKMRELYILCYFASSKGDYEKYEQSKSDFLVKNLTTYNLIYFYADDLCEVYASTTEPIIENLHKMQQTYEARKNKDSFNVPREKLKELLYEDQYHSPEGIHRFFEELFILLKCKMKKPLSSLDFKKTDCSDIPEYNPYSNN